MSGAAPIKVLVVDDSPVVRQVLSDLLAREASIGEVLTAPDGRIALQKIERHDPDLVTLDVEMPAMDGLQTLDRIMRAHPRPVLMISAYTSLGAEKTIRALELGAVDFIQKPVGGSSRSVAEIGAELVDKINAIIETRRGAGRGSVAPSHPGAVEAARAPRTARYAIVAIGASTGGPDATHRILRHLPETFGAGIVVAQHMPEGFTKAYADRLNQVCALEVKEATHHDMIRPGRVLVAPGHSHMRVRRSEYGSYVELSRQPRVGGYRPSVNMLFTSVAQEYGARAIGVLLTGMGRDGAEGLGLMREQGAYTIAQDEASSVVYGMPRAAAETGAAREIAPLAGIAPLLRLLVPTAAWKDFDDTRPAFAKPMQPGKEQGL